MLIARVLVMAILALERDKLVAVGMAVPHFMLVGELLHPGNVGVNLAPARRWGRQTRAPVEMRIIVNIIPVLVLVFGDTSITAIGHATSFRRSTGIGSPLR